jgi:hypothetical protein
MSSHPLVVMFWIPEDSLWFLLLLTDQVQRIPERDYID